MLLWSARRAWRRVLGVPRDMASPVLSANESRILGVLGDNRESSLPDLAVSAKLVPSVVRQVLDRLSAKSLVRVSGNFVGLTPKGVASRNLLIHHQPLSSVGEDDISDDEEHLNAALEAEIDKLER